jgi:hypothetical protein
MFTHRSIATPLAFAARVATMELASSRGLHHSGTMEYKCRNGNSPVEKETAALGLRTTFPRGWILAEEG